MSEHPLDRLHRCTGRDADRAHRTIRPAPYSTADLLADDWDQRLGEYQIHSLAAMTHRLAGHDSALAAANAAAAEIGRQEAAVIREALPELGDRLEEWFMINYDTIASADLREPTDSLARVEFRQQLARMFRQAHDSLLRAGGGDHQQVARDYRIGWWKTHRWTVEQWRELGDFGNTGPELSTKDNRLRVADRLGATRRLARSITQLVSECNAVDQEVKQSSGRVSVF